MNDTPTVCFVGEDTMKRMLPQLADYVEEQTVTFHALTADLYWVEFQDFDDFALFKLKYGPFMSNLKLVEYGFHHSR